MFPTKFPTMIPAGTVIRVGKSPFLLPKAIGLEIIVSKDLQLVDDEGQYEQSKDSTVLKNPNGWEVNDVSHRVNLKYDTIISGAINKYHKHRLQTLEE